MTNRFLCFILTVFILISLPGCKNSYPSETDMEYMVSSIGFDKTAEKVTVFAEVIVVNSADSSKGAVTQILKSDGKTAEMALYNLHSLVSKPLMLNHCGLLILGEGIEGNTLVEILNICLDNKDITGAIKIVATKSAEKLINVKPVSQIAIGYEISEAIKQNSSFSGIVYKNRFYEVEAGRNAATNVFSLPFFTVEEKQHKISGIKIYRNNLSFKTLKGDSISLYSVMSNNFKKGSVKIGDTSFSLKLKSVNYNIEYKNDKLFVKVNLDVDAQNENLNLLANKLENTVIEKRDIYYISDRIYRKERKVWDTIKNDYDKTFKTAEIIFEVD